MECLICHEAKMTREDTVLDLDVDAVFDVCDSCRADAALGRAVRRFKEGMALFRQNPEWAFRQGYSGDIVRRDTPEDALKAAGLMEGEGE